MIHVARTLLGQRFLRADRTKAQLSSAKLMNGSFLASVIGSMSRTWTNLAVLLAGIGFLAPVNVAAQVRNVRAAWERNSDGVTAGYHVLVGTAPNQPLVVLDAGAATSVALPLPVGNRYYISVRGYTASGEAGPATSEALVDLASRPGPPAGLHAEVNGPAATLHWSESTLGGVVSNYLLSVGNAPGATNLLASYPVGNVNAISGELPPGTYYARVTAMNAAGLSAPSEVSFRVSGGYQPAPPSALSASWNGPIATLTWSRPLTDTAGMPTSYQLEAGTAAGMADLGTLNVGDTVAFSVAVPPGTFHVRVRGINARGTSDPSNEVVLRR